VSRQDLQIASLRPWIRTLAERWRRRYAHRLSVDLDDLCQAGALGALKASAKWDPEQASWITYATLWIDEYMRRECEELLLRGADKRANYRRTRELPKFDAVVEDIPVAEGLNEQRVWLRRLVEDAALSERELTIIARCEMGDETLESVGEELGLSRQRVHQVRERALEKLREVVL
jgi:RNA polymerase sigma factor (sigma-70 family)